MLKLNLLKQKCRFSSFCCSVSTISCMLVRDVSQVAFATSTNLLLYVCRPGYCLIAPEFVAMYRQAALLPRTRMGFLFQLKRKSDLQTDYEGLYLL